MMQQVETNGDATNKNSDRKLPKVAAKFENFFNVQLKPVTKEQKQPETAEHGYIVELKVSVDQTNKIRLQNFLKKLYFFLKKPSFRQ